MKRPNAATRFLLAVVIAFALPILARATPAGQAWANAMLEGIPAYEPQLGLSGTLTYVESGTLDALMDSWAAVFGQIYPLVSVTKRRVFAGSGNPRPAPEAVYQLIATDRSRRSAGVEAFEKTIGYGLTAVPVAIKLDTDAGPVDFGDSFPKPKIFMHDLERRRSATYVLIHVKADALASAAVVKEFLKFAQSREGQAIASRAGYLPLNAASDCCEQCVDDCKCCNRRARY